jgi:predicted permease
MLELQYAFRHLRRSPRFSLLAITTLALAIGGTAAFGGLLRGLVFRPLDAPHPEQLVAVTAVDAHGVQGFISLPAFDELRRLQDVFDEVCGYGGTGNATTAAEVNGRIVQRPMEGVAGPCARMLGVQPLLGRLLPEQPANSTVGEPVAVISYGFWQSEFAGDRGVLGQTLRFQGVSLTIIGVTPPATPTLGVELTPDFSVQQAILTQAYRAPEAARVYYIVGRLRAGVTLAAAQARLSALWPGIQQGAVSRPGDAAVRYMRELHEIRVTSAANGISSLRLRYDRPLRLLVGLAAIVLLVACLNVGALLLARAVAREGELAMHLALGATRARVGRQLLAEGMVLSTIGTMAAVPLTIWITRTLVALLWSGPVPLTMSLAPDAITFAGMAIGGLLCGLIASSPAVAFWLTRPERAGGQTRTVVSGTGWMGKTLVVCQLALSLALLFAAGLFFRNLAQLRAIDPGYRTRGILWTRLNELPGRAPITDPVSYSRELVSQLSRLPGVSSVALSYLFPTATASRPLLVRVNGVGALPDSAIKAAPEYASPDFFTLTGVGLIEGRLFTPQDDTTRPPIAIINATLARQLFPDGHVLGKRIHIEGSLAAPESEIVGIVRDASPGDIRISHQAMFYRPIFQEPMFLRVPVVTIRAEEPASLGDSVRRVIASFDQHYPFNVYTLQDTLERALITERTLTGLSAFVGGLGLLLASLGLYALLAYTLGRRQRELGLRMALGASGSTLVRMVIREAAVLLALGLAIGVPAAIGVGRLAGAMLFGLSASDPVTLLVTTLVLVAAVFIALTGPARRVAGIEPAVALRAD